MLMYNVGVPECKKGRSEEIPSESLKWVTYLLHPEQQTDVSAIQEQHTQ